MSNTSVYYDGNNKDIQNQAATNVLEKQPEKQTANLLQGIALGVTYNEDKPSTTALLKTGLQGECKIHLHCGNHHFYNSTSYFTS